MSSVPAMDYAGKAERFSTVAREIRQRARLTLQELSNRSGLAVSTISKMENGQLSPSYETILRLADGLGVDVGELFSAHPETPVATARRSVTRRGQGFIHSSPQYTYEMMSADLSSKAFVPLVTTIKAHSLAEFPSLPRHEGEEFIYVVSGRVEIHTDYYEPVQLEPGDTCYLDSTMGHACISIGKTDAVVVWITSPIGKTPGVSRTVASQKRLSEAKPELAQTQKRAAKKQPARKRVKG